MASNILLTKAWKLKNPTGRKLLMQILIYTVHTFDCKRIFHLILNQKDMPHSLSKLFLKECFSWSRCLKIYFRVWQCAPTWKIKLSKTIALPLAFANYWPLRQLVIHSLIVLFTYKESRHSSLVQEIAHDIKHAS